MELKSDVEIPPVVSIVISTRSGKPRTVFERSHEIMTLKRQKRSSLQHMDIPSVEHSVRPT